MKTYTQKQYDNAKERAYKKGYEAGWKDRFESPTIDDALESANQIKEYKKWEQINFDLSLWLLVLVCIGIVLSMIF